MPPNLAIISECNLCSYFLSRLPYSRSRRKRENENAVSLELQSLSSMVGGLNAPWKDIKYLHVHHSSTGDVAKTLYICTLTTEPLNSTMEKHKTKPCSSYSNSKIEQAPLPYTAVVIRSGLVKHLLYPEQQEIILQKKNCVCKTVRTVLLSL